MNQLYSRTQDSKALNEAIAQERDAIEAWRQLVAAAGDFYANDLKMGARSAGLCDHWRDELAALEEGLTALEHNRKGLRPAEGDKPASRYTAAMGPGDHEPPSVIHRPVTSAVAGKPLTISAEVRDPPGVKWVRLRYRAVNQHEDYRMLPMLETAEKNRYQAVIPAEHVAAQWDLMYLIEVMDNQGNGRIYPDLNLETPYLVVKPSR